MSTTPTSSKLIMKMYQRVEFLMNQFPMMESLIGKLQARILAQEHEIGDVSELVKLYNQVYTFYNGSLDLVRKVFVYFPPATSEEDHGFMLLYLSLSKEDKEQAKKLLQGISDASDNGTIG